MKLLLHVLILNLMLFGFTAQAKRSPDKFCRGTGISKDYNYDPNMANSKDCKSQSTITGIKIDNGNTSAISKVAQAVSIGKTNSPPQSNQDAVVEANFSSNTKASPSDSGGDDSSGSDSSD